MIAQYIDREVTQYGEDTMDAQYIDGGKTHKCTRKMVLKEWLHNIFIERKRFQVTIKARDRGSHCTKIERAINASTLHLMHEKAFSYQVIH